MSCRVAAYNVENMRQLFSHGRIVPDMRPRAEAIGRVISAIEPDILGVVEASDRAGDHDVFLADTGLSNRGYRLGKSDYKRKKQDLVFYYRAPFELLSMDETVDFYGRWVEDIDEDGIEEVCKFERKPLEARFRHRESGLECLFILVSIKSKGVFSVTDLLRHQALALANRKRQYAQAKKIRDRVDILFREEPSLPVIVMGDFNDEPGLDSLERHLGKSALETVMGSIFAPEMVLHNALFHMAGDDRLKRELWTTEYPDLIVQNFGHHRGWLDHILVSPGMLVQEAPRLVKNSGRVAEKTEDARRASDHFAVYCDIEF